MNVAERDLQPDDLTQFFERYRKLTQETARNIVNFYGQRVKLRAQEMRDTRLRSIEPQSQDL